MGEVYPRRGGSAGSRRWGMLVLGEGAVNPRRRGWFLCQGGRGLPLERGGAGPQRGGRLVLEGRRWSSEMGQRWSSEMAEVSSRRGGGYLLEEEGDYISRKTRFTLGERRALSSRGYVGPWGGGG
ncbi:unnamed protein product [Laminaria digitata]